MRMNTGEKLAELQTYVMTWDEEVHYGDLDTSSSWQVLLLPVFADAGVAIDTDGDAYLIGLDNRVAIHVSEDTAIKELSTQLVNASTSQIERYHAWASAMIGRDR